MRFLVFSGLEHHLRRLTPVLDLLRARGHASELVTSQNPWSCRRSDFETALHDRRHHHVADLRGDASYETRARAGRRALARRLAASFAAGEAPAWYPHEQHLGYSLQETVEDRAAFDVLLERLAPDAVLVLHENNFWTRSLVDAAADADLPVFSFQEGTFYDVFPDELLAEHGRSSTRVFLWGERDRTRLAAAGVEAARLRVTGPPHLDRYARGVAEPATRRATMGWPATPHVAYVAPNLGVAPIREGFLHALTAWLGQHAQVRLVVKWRPVESGDAREDVETWLRDRLGPRLTVLDDTDPYDVVLASDIVLGQASTLGPETVALRRPYAEVAWGDDDANISGLAEAGVPVIRRAEDLAELDGWLEGLRDEKPATSAWRTDTFGAMDGRASERAVDEMEQVLAARRVLAGAHVGAREMTR